MQKDKIEFQEFEEKIFQKKIIDYLKQHRESLSIPQIMVGLGLHRDWVDYTVRRLLDVYPCQVSIDRESRQALYLFDFSKKRLSVWKKYLNGFSRLIIRVLEWAWVAAVFLFGITYTFIMTLVFGMIFAANMPLMFFSLFILSVFIDLKAYEKKVAFYADYFWEAVLGFKLMQLNIFNPQQIKVFFLGEKKDRLYAEKLLLDFIRKKDGSITLAEIIQIMGWDIETAREQAIHLVSRFNGNIEVHEKGFLIYVFEELKGEIKDSSFFPRIWNNLLPLKKLCKLTLPQFREMLWRIGLAVVYVSGHLVLVLILLMLNTHHPQEYFGDLFFLGLPIILLCISYLMMFLRHLWHLYLNQGIRNENTKRSIIKQISLSRGILPAAQGNTSICLALGGQALVREDGSMYYWFEEFTNPDLPEIKKYNTCILYERFENNQNKWSLIDNENVQLSIENGKYHFSHKRDTGSWETQIGRQIDTSKSYFKIETSLELLDASEDGLYGGYGLLFGRYKFTSGYKFLIASVGQFCILENINDRQKKTILDWTISEHIRQGKATNKLTVMKEKEQIIFLINQVEVHRSPFLAFYGNGVGFVTNYQMKIAIDDLYIEQEQ